MVKGGPNLENSRIIIFAGVFVQVLLMVGVSASVFWLVVVVGARDAGGFPARVAGLLVGEWPCHIRTRMHS